MTKRTVYFKSIYADGERHIATTSVIDLLIVLKEQGYGLTDEGITEAARMLSTPLKSRRRR